MIVVLIILFILLIVLMFSSVKNTEQEKINNTLKLIEEYRNKNQYIIDKYTYHDIDRIQLNEILNRISYSLTREEK